MGLHLALYFKQAGVALRRFYSGGGWNSSQSFTVYPPYRTGPTSDYSFHRRAILRRDENADRLVKFDFSLFSMFKFRPLAPPVSESTLRSISDPVSSLDAWACAIHLDPYSWGMFRRYKRFPKVCLLYRRGSPYHLWLGTVVLFPAAEMRMEIDEIRSIFTCLFAAFLVQFTHSRGEQWSQGVLWESYTRYARKRSEFLFERRIGPLLPLPEQWGIPPLTGRLGCSCEEANIRHR